VKHRITSTSTPTPLASIVTYWTISSRPRRLPSSLEVNLNDPPAIHRLTKRATLPISPQQCNSQPSGNDAGANTRFLFLPSSRRWFVIRFAVLSRIQVFFCREIKSVMSFDLTMSWHHTLE